MKNNRGSPILKLRVTVGTLLLKYALYAAIFLAISKGFKDMAWPIEKGAMEEEHTEKHAGFYWIDTQLKVERSHVIFCLIISTDFGNN